jgi:histidinol-phosphate aminotransferase
MTAFESLATDAIRGLRAYDPGHDLVALRRLAASPLLELGSNENPYGASAKAKQAAVEALATAHVYPDPLGGNLKRALANKYAIAPSNILLGNGSHELLMQFAQVFAGAGDEVVASQYGFSVYALAAQAAGASLRLASALPVDAVMPRGHDLAALQAAVTERTKLVYVANPNNPTGTWYDAQAFVTFLQGLPKHVIVVVDEAYAEFADAPDYASALSLVPSYPQLVVMRTFSKAYALAGLRVGYAVAHANCIAIMERVRESFNVNAIALAAAEAALADAAYLAACVAQNNHQREALAQAFRQRGFAVSPSQTNFLLVEFAEKTEEIEAALRSKGIILRPMGGYGLGQCLRITVGTEQDNLRLLTALDEVIA